MSNTDVSWRWDLVVFRLCNQNPTLSQRQIDVKYWHQPDFHFQPKCNVCLTSCPTSTWRYIDVWCLLGLFGVLPENVKLAVLEMDNIALCTLLARRLILINWKLPSPPTYLQWVFDLLFALRLEKIKFGVQLKPDLFIKSWSPFLEHFKEAGFE